ncbi:MAG: HAD domain-containing protein [Saprospiraceae bacterium]|nr:HAD domain-containing protein [Saprospiraceae bacterium]
MKILFLDIDGVMTSSSTQPIHIQGAKLYPFSKESVQALNSILQTQKVKIVLTSSWRNVFDVEKQCQIFEENGIIQMPYGQTTNLKYEKRDIEISNYLKNKNIESILILDDMYISGFEAYLLQTNASTGLLMSDVPRAIGLLHSSYKNHSAF